MNKKFSIKVMDKVFESDEDGMLDLNDIWRGCDLPKTKRPSQWRSKIKEELTRYANLHTVENQTLTIKNDYTVGDERATVAYAMWVSFDFYCSVLDAFLELRRGNLEQAVKIAGSTMSEEDNYLLQKIAKQKGVCFQKSCWIANIKHPQKVMEKLLSHPKWKYFAKNEHGKIYATEDGVESGLFYNCYGSEFSKNVVMRVTQKGREKFRQHSQWFNEFCK